MKNETLIVALTGAESTGKSTLTEALSKHYQVPFVPEFARDYIRSLNRRYTFDDVEFITKKQVEQYKNLVSSGNAVILLDTWLLITKIWFEVVFNQVPEWLEESIRNTKIDLFLVCDTDLPWEADDVRENGGENRIRLQQRYIDEIKKYGFNYHLIQGEGNTRTQNAIDIIDRLLNKDQQI